MRWSTYPLLYFTTNFCESTFSISSPPAERVTPPQLGGPSNCLSVWSGHRLSQCRSQCRLPIHFLRDAVDRPIRDWFIMDLLAIMLWPLAVLGRVR